MMKEDAWTFLFETADVEPTQRDQTSFISV